MPAARRRRFCTPGARDAPTVLRVGSLPGMHWQSDEPFPHRATRGTYDLVSCPPCAGQSHEPFPYWVQRGTYDLLSCPPCAGQPHERFPYR